MPPYAADADDALFSLFMIRRFHGLRLMMPSSPPLMLPLLPIFFAVDDAAFAFFAFISFDAADFSPPPFSATPPLCRFTRRRFFHFAEFIFELFSVTAAFDYAITPRRHFFADMPLR
jgi:hypothetical protein